MYLDLASDYIPAFNPLYRVPVERHSLVAKSIVEAFKHVYRDTSTPLMDPIFANAIMAVLELQDRTLADVLKFMNTMSYRSYVLDKLENKKTKEFWKQTFPLLNRGAQTPFQSSLNRLEGLLSDRFAYRIFSQRVPKIDLEDVLASKILLVNASKGLVGDRGSNLFTSILIDLIGITAMGRQSRSPFTLIVDEFGSFTTSTFISMLSELRKYKVRLVLANQYLGQLEDDTLASVLGNVGSKMVYRVSEEDAEVLSKGFVDPSFNVAKLSSLPNFHAACKVLESGSYGPPFIARMLPLPPPVSKKRRERVIRESRRFCRKRKKRTDAPSSS